MSSRTVTSPGTKRTRASRAAAQAFEVRRRREPARSPEAMLLCTKVLGAARDEALIYVEDLTTYATDTLAMLPAHLDDWDRLLALSIISTRAAFKVPSAGLRVEEASDLRAAVISGVLFADVARVQGAAPPDDRQVGGPRG